MSVFHSAFVLVAIWAAFFAGRFIEKRRWERTVKQLADNKPGWGAFGDYVRDYIKGDS